MQGSDFARSVESQHTVAVKSLETITPLKVIEEPKCSDEVKEGSPSLKVESPAPQYSAVKLVDILEAKMTTPLPVENGIVIPDIKPMGNLTKSLTEIKDACGKKDTNAAEQISPKSEQQGSKPVEQNTSKECSSTSSVPKKPELKTNNPTNKTVSPPKTGKKQPVNNKTPTGNITKTETNLSNKPKVPPKPAHLIGTPIGTKTGPTKPTKKPPPPPSDDDDDEDYFEYKFTPRQVFICTICQTCKHPLTIENRLLCQGCQMVSYCSAEHVTSDASGHKDLCLAIQEIAKKRG